MEKMSKDALKRCRTMHIKNESTPGDYVVKFTVTDPRGGDRVVAKHTARTEHDVIRIEASFKTKWRIPEANVIREGEFEKKENTSSLPSVGLVPVVTGEGIVFNNE